MSASIYGIAVRLLAAISLLWLATACTASGSLPARHDAAISEPKAGCMYGDWTAPREVHTGAPGRLLSEPSIVALEDGPLLSGRTRPITFRGGPPSRSISEYSLGLIGSTGREVAPPSGDYWFLNPLTASDSAGALHAVWGEPESSAASDDRRGPPVRTSSVWYASYRPGPGWSRPELIFSTPEQGDAVGWTGTRAIVFDSSGRLHVAFGQPGGGVHHLVRDDGAWRVSSIDGINAASLDVAVGADGRLM